MRHTCSACAHASFNTYWNWKVLVLKGCDHLIHNKEVFTQGDPLDMILYGLGVLPIIQALKYHMEDTEKKSRRNTLQVRYDYDSTLDSSLSRIKSWFTYLIRIGPPLRYQHDPEKSLLVTLESKLYLATTFVSE